MKKLLTVAALLFVVVGLRAQGSGASATLYSKGQWFGVAVGSSVFACSTSTIPAGNYMATLQLIDSATKQTVAVPVTVNPTSLNNCPSQLILTVPASLEVKGTSGPSSWTSWFMTGFGSYTLTVPVQLFVK